MNQSWNQAAKKKKKHQYKSKYKKAEYMNES